MSDKTSDKTSDKRLLPCPFCGVELHKHHRYYHHEINGCLFDDYEFFEEDFEKWNTRKPMQEIVKRLEKKIDNKLYNPNWNAGIIASISVVESVGGITMSEQYRTKQEYTENYANVYCNGDQEEAAGHAIVKEVCKNLESE